MPIKQDNTIAIYFGDNSDKLFMNDYQYDSFKNAPDLLAMEPFTKLHSIMPIKQVIFPRQVHGTSGFIVDSQNLSSKKPFSIEGDYVITNLSGIGIGVLTADCLPILMHDPVNQVIAAIHAGWRGSVAGIAIKALEDMRRSFGTEPKDLRVFFGPSAGSCCYTVGPEVIEAVKPYQEQVLTTSNNQSYFDIITYNRLLLEAAGVTPPAFCTDYALCTMCNDQFWSYRRQQKAAGRQMTVITLLYSTI